MTARTRTTRRAPGGFTLLEVLIALAMTAVLSAALYVTLAIAFDGRDVVREQASRPGEAAIAMTLIRRDLEAALPVTQGAGLVGPLTGEATGIEFYHAGRDVIGPAPGELGIFSEGVRRTTFAFEPGEFDEQGGRLVRLVERNLLSETRELPPAEQLLTGLADVRFRYYDGSSWRERWSPASYGNALPSAVEVTITLPAEPGREPYVLRQTIPISCATDSSLGGLL